MVSRQPAPSQATPAFERAHTFEGRLPRDLPQGEHDRRLEICLKTDRVHEKATRHYESEKTGWIAATQEKPYTQDVIDKLKHFNHSQLQPKWAVPTSERVIGHPISQKDATVLIGKKQEKRLSTIEATRDQMIEDGQFASTGVIIGNRRGGGTDRKNPS